MGNPLLDRLKKNSTIKETAILSESTFFAKKEFIRTPIPILNVMQSGEVDGGFSDGLTFWAGPSKHFKTKFLLLNAKAYLDKYPDAIILFYDSEFGSPQSYFKQNGIDPERVLHVPISNIEMFKFDIAKQLDGLQRGDHVFIAVDSIGNLASIKEVEDALEGKSKADMTRAKAIKSLFRIITPQLTIKNLPMHVVAHTYDTQEMYSKKVVSGGTGIMYSATNVYIIGRQQEKEDDEVVGWNFVVNVEKSRYVREKSKVLVNVRYDTGVSPWSGLLELALEFGLVTKPKNGWYTRPTVEGDKNWREAATDAADFWAPIFKDTNFADCIKTKYALPDGETNPNSNSLDVGEETDDD